MNTLREHTEGYLELHGWQQKPCRSGRYHQWEHPTIKAKIFLGSKGAIRYGNNASTSRAITESMFVHLVKLSAERSKV